MVKHLAQRSLLKHWFEIVGFGLMANVLFCATLGLCVSFFQILEPLRVFIVAKIISLIGLAMFGQSEALRHYLKTHTENDAGLLVNLNKIGTGVTIVTVMFLVARLLGPSPEHNHEAHSGVGPWGASDMWRSLGPYADLLAFLPVVYFAVVNLTVWCAVPDEREIGRTCFIIGDLPVLVPMATVVLLSGFWIGYRTEIFHQLVGGATVMFILVSMILNQCSRSLLRVDGDPK